VHDNELLYTQLTLSYERCMARGCCLQVSTEAVAGGVGSVGSGMDRATYEAAALGAKLDAGEGVARPKRKRNATDLGLAKSLAGESRRALIHCNYCHTVRPASSFHIVSQPTPSAVERTPSASTAKV
jgi:hypothetical protein